jgi:ribosomal protein L27
MRLASTNETINRIIAGALLVRELGTKQRIGSNVFANTRRNEFNFD